jgi:hypothetical protein
MYHLFSHFHRDDDEKVKLVLLNWAKNFEIQNSNLKEKCG